MSGFLEQLTQAMPLASIGRHRLLLAVSGGADSTALLRGMIQWADRHELSRDQIVVGHFHHGQRDSADEEQHFVQQLCESQQVQCCCERANLEQLLEPASDGWEARARELRYDFLLRTAQSQMARFVLTAHTADDQAETVLFRLLRGTGWRGLTGIPAISLLSPDITLLRPMLRSERSEVLAYLRSLDQAYCHDETNDQSTYTRNRLRNEVLPLLNQVMGRDTRPQIVALAARTQGLVEWIEAEAGKWAREVAALDNRETIRLEPSAWSRIPGVLRAEVARWLWRQADWPQQAMTEEHWMRLVDSVLDLEYPPLWQLPGGIRVERRDGQLWLTRRVDET